MRNVAVTAAHVTSRPPSRERGGSWVRKAAIGTHRKSAQTLPEHDPAGVEVELLELGDKCAQLPHHKASQGGRREEPGCQ
jgi:hypothetical protein